MKCEQWTSIVFLFASLALLLEKIINNSHYKHEKLFYYSIALYIQFLFFSLIALCHNSKEHFDKYSSLGVYVVTLPLLLICTIVNLVFCFYTIHALINDWDLNYLDAVIIIISQALSCILIIGLIIFGFIKLIDYLCPKRHKEPVIEVENNQNEIRLD